MLADGRTVSMLPVCLRIDKEAPWAHVSWVMHALMESGVCRFFFEATSDAGDRHVEEERRIYRSAGRLDRAKPRGGSGWVRAFSPWNGAFATSGGPTDARDGDEVAASPPSTRDQILVSVELAGYAPRGADADQEGEPHIVFEVGSARLSGLSELREYVDRMSESTERDGGVIVRVGAPPLVPYKYVIAAFHALDRAEVGAIHLEYEYLPSEQIRAAATLPPPDPNARRNLAGEILPPLPESGR